MEIKPRQHQKPDVSHAGLRIPGQQRGTVKSAAIDRVIQHFADQCFADWLEAVATHMFTKRQSDGRGTVQLLTDETRRVASGETSDVIVKHPFGSSGGDRDQISSKSIRTVVVAGCATQGSIRPSSKSLCRKVLSTPGRTMTVPSCTFAMQDEQVPSWQANGMSAPLRISAESNDSPSRIIVEYSLPPAIALIRWL